MLLRFMRQSTPSEFAPIIRPPLTIVVRGSSDAFHIENPLVAKAFRQMQGELDSPLKIHSILKKLGVSRPKLEQSFRDELGRTPLVALRFLRIERANTNVC